MSRVDIQISNQDGRFQTLATHIGRLQFESDRFIKSPNSFKMLIIIINNNQSLYIKNKTVT